MRLIRNSIKNLFCNHDLEEISCMSWDDGFGKCKITYKCRKCGYIIENIK